CEQYHVKLNCHLAPSANLPKMLAELPEAQITPDYSSHIIESTDVDVTIAQLNEKRNWKVIDVSELTTNDLLTRMTGTMDKKNCSFSFRQQDGALKTALLNNEKVILKGKFSDEIADGLAQLLLEKPDNLVVVTENAKNLKFMGFKNHQVTTDEKYAVL